MDNVNPSAVGLTPYAPGKPIDELARELGISDIIKLASNENPRGPGPGVHAAIGAASATLSRYPDGTGYLLKRQLAEHLGTEVARLTLGNGSNDVLDLVARAVLEPGSEAIVSEHAFVVYRLATVSCGGRLVVVPARDYGADLDAMLNHVTPATRVVFLANPNNPTGTWVDETALRSFLDAIPERIWVVLDEAYHEYVTLPGYPDGMKLSDAYPNVVVTRTFSKIHGLASLRIGYGVSNPALADLMNRLRQPFNVNSMALAAAEAALLDVDFVAESRRLNEEGMAVLEAGIDRLGLARIPSAGNFLTFAVTDALAVYDRLLKAGVIVRPVAEYGLTDHLRVTVGAPGETARFLKTLEAVL